MAVNKPEKDEPRKDFVSNFWKVYQFRVLFLILGLNLVIMLGLALAISLVHDMVNITTWLVLGGFIAVSTILLAIAVLVALKPFSDVNKALVYASGETTRDTPPHLNSMKSTGLRPLLQLIYDLSSGNNTGKTDDVSSDSGVVTSGLQRTATGIVMLDSKQRVVYSNRAAPVSTDQDGVVKLDLIFDADTTLPEWIAAQNKDSVRATKSWRRIANKLTGEENRRIFDVFASYEQGSSVETILTMVDMTDDYSPEDDELDFIAFAAHELRGPITVIRGYLDTLNDELVDVTDSEQKELFNRLVVSANRLSGYINNILNASRYDRRHLKLHLQEHKLDDIYSNIADDMQLRARSQRRALTVDIPTNLPTVAADKSSVSEVMSNLIDNAIKYSNEGGVIDVSAISTGQTVELSVTDRGIGMPSNVVSNLFHKFYRSHRSRETVAGTGIGLYISKAIVESHGGSMSVQSVEGQGSTFTFSLPTYESVAEKLNQAGGDNQQLIERHGGSWIKNHGTVRG